MTEAQAQEIIEVLGYIWKATSITAIAAVLIAYFHILDLWRIK